MPFFRAESPVKITQRPLTWIRSKQDRGRPVAAGVYLVRLRTGAEVLTTRAALVR